MQVNITSTQEQMIIALPKYTTIKVMAKMDTWGSGPFEEDLFSGDHGKARANILMDSVTKLGPRAALYGVLAEAGIGKLPNAGSSGDLHFVTLVVELVLDDFLDPVLVGTYDLLRRQQKAEVLAVVFIQLSPPELARLGSRCLRHHLRMIV